MWQGHKEKPTSTRSMAREVVHPERPLPPWSRLLEHNAEGCLRKRSGEKEEHYEVEISNHLWSLWGSTQQVKPGENSSSSESGSERTSPPGQALACCVLACCAGSFQSLDSWNSSALDKIMSNGRGYYDESLATRQHWDRTGELCLECLNTTCFLDGHEFWVDIEKLCTGKLYSRTKSLGSALSKFFGQHLQTGILQLRDQALAFGFIPEFASGRPSSSSTARRGEGRFSRTAKVPRMCSGCESCSNCSTACSSHWTRGATMCPSGSTRWDVCPVLISCVWPS